MAQEMKLIPKKYFQNPDILFLAENLLGKYLCTHFDNTICKAKIVETEAYKAPEDRGSHAYQNKRTKRTEIMFGDGGFAYVYLCYGIHSMMNIVSGPKESAHAILIRAVEPIENIDMFRKRVKTKKKDILLGSGPGNVCKSMGIHTSNYGESLFRKSTIWIEEDHQDEQKKIDVVKSPRVGIAYAKEWATEPWRFYIKDHPAVSKPKIAVYPS